MTRRLTTGACILLILMMAACTDSTNESGRKEKVIIFHAGSLSVPLKEMTEKYEEENPGINIQLEADGSVACARKITDLKKPCDIMASADFRVIDEMLIPDYTSWNIKFASNSMVIAFNDKSFGAGEITRDNWYNMLLDDEAIYGRSDPDSDPCGYRTVMTCKLAEKFYNKPGISDELVAKNRNMIRPKGVELLALLETNAVDYIFLYKSVSQQHNLKYIDLPDEINLSEPGMENLYQSVSVDILGKSPGEKMTLTGSTMVYGVTLLKDAPNREQAIDFLKFMLGGAGMSIIESNGQKLISPPETAKLDLLPEMLRSVCSEE
ncbi:MAG TPA: tungstate ABC transporter substrate-binding protein WtpA [Bacteroidales bacterium]|nr:tungstate ABC transporter substrate-binding protein WtpA [Bacteroidales bacterium]